MKLLKTFKKNHIFGYISLCLFYLKHYHYSIDGSAKNLIRTKLTQDFSTSTIYRYI